MEFRKDGHKVDLNKNSRDDGCPNNRAIPNSKVHIPGNPSSKILISVHGLCMNDQLWTRKGHNHALKVSSILGYTNVTVNYNSGLHISTNGQTLAEGIEALVSQWPVAVSQIILLGHSMGGLLVRSACHYSSMADYSWRNKLKSMIFLGSPHHGAPLEKGGNWLNILLDQSPYTTPFTYLGNRRSCGITDLRFGYLLDRDWLDREPNETDSYKYSVPLPKDVNCFLVAGSRTNQTDCLSYNLIGDGIVPVKSALGIHKDPDHQLGVAKENTFIAKQTHHLDLLSSQEVYEKMVSWLLPEEGKKTP
jgi:pimeloyl-ACP methyl ester carboxylesterase